MQYLSIIALTIALAGVSNAAPHVTRQAINGSDCGFDFQCKSNNCLNGICQDPSRGAVNGSDCGFDSQCRSGNCQDGICQDPKPKQTTGSAINGSDCSFNDQCLSGNCKGASARLSTTEQPSTVLISVSMTNASAEAARMVHARTKSLSRVVARLLMALTADSMISV
ncbi:hypothetical protein V2G26_005870 [Clonostachys chloroleuca]